MRILLNFVPLKSGGGVQVGLDFINHAKAAGAAHEWYLAASAGTPFEAIAPSRNFRTVAVVASDLCGRLYFEYFACRSLIRRVMPDIVYAQFGFHWPGARDIPHLAGCATSNLMYPEIDFWASRPWPVRLLRRARDHHRRRVLRGTQHIVFENQDLAERAVRLLGIDKDRVHVVKSAPSSLLEASCDHKETAEQVALIPKGFRVLLFSGYQPNKNFTLLPHIAATLKSRLGMHDVVFVTTLPHAHRGTRRFRRLAAEIDVEGMICNIGPVRFQGIATLYRAIDAVILPSRLESFSNTIAEAWAMGKPLLISDLGWARAICADGALYVAYRDVDDIAAKICELRQSPVLRARLVDAGRAVLHTYPTARERFMQYLQLMESCAAASQRLDGGHHPRSLPKGTP